jgi:hypothetical protein
MKKTIIVVLIFFVVCGILTAFGVGVDNTPPPPAEPITIPQIDYVAIGWVVAGLVVIVLLVFALRAGYVIPVIAIAIIVGLFYVINFSDKNNDGQADVQIVRMIQPTGGDATTDAAYSEINKTNSVSNISGAGTFAIYSVAFVLGAIGISFLFLMKKH